MESLTSESAITLVIPTIYNGVEITSIAPQVFSGNMDGMNKVTDLIIPEGITNIGEFAFEECTNIKKVTIEGEPVIRSGAFMKCSSLQNLYILNNATLDGNQVFAECINLVTVEMPYVTKIDNSSSVFSRL